MLSTLQGICCPTPPNTKFNRTCSKAVALADFAIFVSMIVIGLIGTFNANHSFALPATGNWLLVAVGLVGLALLAAKKTPSPLSLWSSAPSRRGAFDPTSLKPSSIGNGGMYE